MGIQNNCTALKKNKKILKHIQTKNPFNLFIHHWSYGNLKQTIFSWSVKVNNKVYYSEIHNDQYGSSLRPKHAFKSTLFSFLTFCFSCFSANFCVPIILLASSEIMFLESGICRMQFMKRTDWSILKHNRRFKENITKLTFQTRIQKT